MATLRSPDDFTKNEVFELFQERNLNRWGQGQRITYYVAETGGNVLRTVNNFEGYAMQHMIDALEECFANDEAENVIMYGVNAPTDRCAESLMHFQRKFGIKIDMQVVSSYYCNKIGLWNLEQHPGISLSAFNEHSWLRLRELLYIDSWSGAGELYPNWRYKRGMRLRDDDTANKLALIDGLS